MAFISPKIANILGILLIAIASFCNSTIIIFLATSLIVYGASKTTKGFFLGGVIFHITAFYWLPETLIRFGGFPYFIGILLLILFALLSSIQFYLVAWLFRLIKPNTGVFALALSWATVDFLLPKLFPWSLVHPTIESKLFNAPVSIGGYWLGSFFLILLFSAFFELITAKKFRGFIPFVIFILPPIYNQKEALLLDSIGIIQPNINPFSTKYRLSLKDDIEGLNGDLIILPESSDSNLLSEDSAVHTEEIFDYSKFNKFLLFGGIEMSKDRHLKNTAFYVDNNHNILNRYSKIILMPFGEFLPFEKFFPWLRTISPESGDFLPGQMTPPIKYKEILLSVIICYEDLIPQISLDNVRNGAQLLVNLTNDMWYGKSYAAYQHDTLARWRSIEVGVPLIRVTNTGHTTVTLSNGDLYREFKEHERHSELLQLDTFTIKTLFRTVGNFPMWIISILSLLCLIPSKRNTK